MQHMDKHNILSPLDLTGDLLRRLWDYLQGLPGLQPEPAGA